MAIISYVQKGKKDLDLIKPLWEKLKKYHALHSPHFTQEYENKSFADRKEFLLAKSKSGALRMDLAYGQEKKLLGYCVSTINHHREGEIDSLFVEREYRSRGIGNELINRALDWMEKEKVERKSIMVAAGNGETLPFYEKHGFILRSIILEQKSKTEIKKRI
jgi:diamine N-acetyltransferase